MLGSRLHVAPVDAKGKLTAAPKPINNEVTDAPSWSGDSKTILYLCNGKLQADPGRGRRGQDGPACR